MAINLPTPVRTEGGDPGRRGVRLPGAADVPMVNAARDPGVAFSRDSLSAAGAAGRGIAEIGDVLGKIAEKQQKLEDATKTTEAHTAFEEAGMQEFRRRQTEDDPSRSDFMADYNGWLSAKRDEVLNPLVGKISPDAYDRARARFDESRRAMADSAGRLQLDALQKKASDQIDGQINKWSAQASRDPGFLDTFLGMADDGLSEYSGALSPDGERNARMKARSSIIVSAYSGLLDQKQFDKAEALLKDPRFDEDVRPETRKTMMTALDTGRKEAQSELRADVRLQLEDEVASIRETGVGIGLSSDRIRAAYGDKSDHILKTLSDERAFYQAKSTIALNTPEQDAALVESLKPSGEGFKAEGERRDHAVKAIVQKYDALSKDPASYVMSASKEVRAAFQTAGDDPVKLRRAVTLMDETQARLGVPEPQRRILSDEQAKAMANTITKVSPEIAADTLQTLADKYGDEMWPRVYSDLVRAKLPPDYTVLATTDNPVARKALGEALKAEVADKGALRRRLNKDDATTVDEGIVDALREFQGTLAYAPNGAVVADRYRSAAQLLAYQYAATMSPAEAAKRAAADLIADKYDFLQDSQHNARVPRGMARAAVDTADRTIAGLTADMLPDPGGAPELTDQRRREIALSAVKRGTWVTNEKDNGLVRLDVNQQPVFRIVRDAEATPGPTGDQPGMVEAGNIDLAKRPKVRNADGSISTVRSMSFNDNGAEVLIPTVAADGSHILSNQEAIAQYRKTGQHLGKFDTPENATSYALALHDAQNRYYLGGRLERVEVKFSDATPNAVAFPKDTSPTPTNVPVGP